MKDKIIIGSRESRLAVIQAEMVQDYLQKSAAAEDGSRF